MMDELTMKLQAAIILSSCILVALNTTDLFNHLDGLNQIFYDQAVKAPRAIIRELREDMMINLTYNSLAIEGSLVTREETKLIINGTGVPKPQRDHDEVTNTFSGTRFIRMLLEKNIPLCEDAILELHKLLMRWINDKSAGVYRRVIVVNEYGKYKPPSWELVPKQMEEYVTWYETTARELHAVERAALVHANFMRIHPFVDFNGRTARLLMNMELLRDDFPPITVPLQQCNQYFKVLDDSLLSGQYDKFVQLIATFVEESLNIYTQVLNANSSELTHPQAGSNVKDLN